MFGISMFKPGPHSYAHAHWHGFGHTLTEVLTNRWFTICIAWRHRDPCGYCGLDK